MEDLGEYVVFRDVDKAVPRLRCVIVKKKLLGSINQL